MGGMMASDVSIWEKVAAVGQGFGALATFLAVYVALIIARKESRVQVRVSARDTKIVSEAGSIDAISVTVENIGLRTAKIDGIGWMGGLASWKLPKVLRWLVPSWLRQRTLFQIPDYTWLINDNFPWRLQRGESKSTHFKEALFFREFSEGQGEAFFRRIPLMKKIIAVRPRVFVSVDTQPITLGMVDSKIVENMRKAYLGSHPPPS